MIQLFLNGKLVDYGTKPDLSMYIRMGYTVKVLNQKETVEYRAKLRVKNIWSKLPGTLRKRIAFIIRNEKLSWSEKHTAILNTLDTIIKRACRINVVHHKQEKEWTIGEQLIGVYNDICSVFSAIKNFLTPQTAAQYALA